MNFFNIDLKKWFFVILALMLPLVSINMEQKPLGTNWMSRPFMFMTSMVQDGLYEFSSGVKDTTSQYLNLLSIKKDNASLRMQNRELTTRQLNYQALELENVRLRNMLDFKQKTKMSLIAAQVIGRDLVPDHHTITINKGTQNGLKSGQAVIALNGVVGYVFRPDVFTSHIMLITDRYAVADGMIQRTRASGIVEGKGTQSLVMGTHSLVMKYVDRTEDVQQGDLVVTGGLDNIFPKGFPLAVIENVERKTMSISLRVELRPLMDPSTIEDVFVIANAANEDIPTQAQANTLPKNTKEGITQ